MERSCRGVAALSDRFKVDKVDHELIQIQKLVVHVQYYVGGSSFIVTGTNPNGQLFEYLTHIFKFTVDSIVGKHVLKNRWYRHSQNRKIPCVTKTPTTTSGLSDASDSL